jgi:hypothetical protein
VDFKVPEKASGSTRTSLRHFFCSNGKNDEFAASKKNAQITLDDQKVMFFQVYYQNHLNMASTGPQMDLKWDSK